MFDFSPSDLKNIDLLNSLMLNIINRDIYLQDDIRIHLFSVHFNYQQKGHIVEEHEHATFEMSIPLCGGIITRADGEKIVNDANDPSILLLPPGILHDRIFFENEETINISWVFSIEFDKKDNKIPLLLNNYAKQICQQKHFKIEVYPLIYDMMKTFFDAVRKHEAGLSVLASELFKTMLLLILQKELPEFFKANTEFPLAAEISADREKIIKKACIFVLSNNNICQALANDMGISVRHLNRIFYEKNGMSVTQYRNNLRFNHACELLCNTDMKISEIGSLVGFKNPVSFNAFFKKHAGCSPQKMRTDREADSKKFR